MKIVSTVKNVKVLAKEATQSKDGNNTYYKLAVLCGSECGNVSCSKEVFDAVVPDKSFDIVATYNDQYKSFKFDGVVLAPVK